MNDSSDWTFVIAFLCGGLILGIAMPTMFWLGMKSYYKEKFARKEHLNMPYRYELEGAVSSRLIFFFCTPLGVWMTVCALISIVESNLSTDQVFAITNWITAFVSTIIIALVWIDSHSVAKLTVLEFKLKTNCLR